MSLEQVSLCFCHHENILELQFQHYTLQNALTCHAFSSHFYCLTTFCQITGLIVGKEGELEITKYISSIQFHLQQSCCSFFVLWNNRIVYSFNPTNVPIYRDLLQLTKCVQIHISFLCSSHKECYCPVN